MINATEKSCMRTVDQNELRVNSAFVVTVLVTAFIINRWELVAFQAVTLLLTTLHQSLGPYVALYRHVLRPAGIVKPDLRIDNPEPHRFATMFGTIVASAATYLLVTEKTVATIVTVDEWTFNFGPNEFMQQITFEDGRVVRIESLGYGYRGN